ncbi:MAG: spore coat protein U domain-containing protein [Nitrosomonadales bacterium]|jgi:spore coat protein U-like protein
MKTSNTVKLVTVLALAAGFTTVQAATLTATLTNTTTVSSSCAMAAGGGLAFGAYTSNQVVPLNASTTVIANCSLNTPYSISLDGGLHTGAAYANVRALASGALALAYVIKMDSQVGLGWGNNDIHGGVKMGTGTGVDQTYTVAGSVSPSQPASSGTYTDTVVATITY